jgi:hypothetical protein
MSHALARAHAVARICAMIAALLAIGVGGLLLSFGRGAFVRVLDAARTGEDVSGPISPLSLAQADAVYFGLGAGLVGLGLVMLIAAVRALRWVTPVGICLAVVGAGFLAGFLGALGRWGIAGVPSEPVLLLLLTASAAAAAFFARTP